MDDNVLFAAILGSGILGISAFLLVVYLPMIFYFITLQGAMNRIDPLHKPFAGELIWLGLIPVFGHVWQLVYAIVLSNALQKEFAANGRFTNGAMPIAIGMAISAALCLVPFVNLVAGLVLCVLWIAYWIKIAALKQQLPMTGGR